VVWHGTWFMVHGDNCQVRERNTLDARYWTVNMLTVNMLTGVNMLP
jgi:hypothetical protein